jgi:hypothetical protein
MEHNTDDDAAPQKQQAELAQLKGQMVAIEQASIQKKCGIQFQQAPRQG